MMYKGEAKRDYEFVNFSDKETGVIAVFIKQEDSEYNLLTTTWNLTPLEEDYLLKSGGNFVTENTF